MPDLEHFEILILGSGAGGKLLAWHMAKLGKRTVVVERRWIGGSCPNIACLPTKNEIFSAKVAHTVKHAADFGTIVGAVKLDMAKVRQRKRKMVEDLVVMHIDNYNATGAKLIRGNGRFVSPKTLSVELNDGGGTRLLTSDKVFINVGTHAAIPNISGLAAAKPLTHIESLELDYSPEHLIVLGGGYVGLELAQAYRRFGSKVTIIEAGEQLMKREDYDVAQQMHEILAREGVDILLTTEVLSVEGQSGKKVTLTVRTKAGQQKITGSDILVAAGRIPNTANIGLELLGIELDQRGYIRVNDRLETNVPDIWAIGECAGSPQFTHVSEDDFKIIKDNLAGANRSTKNRLIPYCLFTDPELAHVGLSEKDAQRQGIKVRVAKLPTSAILRTRTTDERQGFLKIIVSAENDNILGFTMIGSEAGEMMAAMQMAIIAELPYSKICDAIIAHPTMAEGLSTLCAKIPALEQAKIPAQLNIQ